MQLGIHVLFKEFLLCVCGGWGQQWPLHLYSAAQRHWSLLFNGCLLFWWSSAADAGLMTAFNPASCVDFEGFPDLKM